MVTRAHHHLSVDEYLMLEADGRVRHEYLAGEIFAMTGASVRHNLIAMNIANALYNHLRGGPCRAFMSDVKVRLKINQDDFLYYPDVMVACGRDGVEEYYLRNPKLIVEVLSPSTEAIDRREKSLHYRRIPTLEEYVLVAQEAPEVTILRRSDDWQSLVLTSPESMVELCSIELSLPVAQIYEGLS